MRIFLIIILFLIISAPIFSQLNGAGDFPEKYRSLFLGFGPRTLDTDPGTINIDFTDESPSMDHLNSTIEIEDSYNKVGFQLGYKWGRYKGLSHSFLFDIALGDHQGGLFSYALGYNIPFKLGKTALLIGPSFSVGFGNYGFDIGQLKNNAGYIEINGIEYYENALDVSLSSQVFIYGPQLDLTWMLADNFEVYFNINYDLTSDNSNPKVDFTPASSSNSSGTSVDIDYDNLFIEYNNNPLSSLPYDVSGLRITFGVAYVWNR